MRRRQNRVLGSYFPLKLSRIVAMATCVFGAEAFVITDSRKWECLSMLKKSANGIYIYKMENFSALANSFYNSKAFKVGERNWYALSILLLINLCISYHKLTNYIKVRWVNICY